MLGKCTGALTVGTWRLCQQLTPEEAVAIEPATQKSGYVSKDDDDNLTVMEVKVGNLVKDIPSRFSHILYNDAQTWARA